MAERCGGRNADCRRRLVCRSRINYVMSVDHFGKRTAVEVNDSQVRTALTAKRLCARLCNPRWRRCPKLASDLARVE